MGNSKIEKSEGYLEWCSGCENSKTIPIQKFDSPGGGRGIVTEMEGCGLSCNIWNISSVYLINKNNHKIIQMPSEESSEDLLKIEDFYDRASTGKRLANFLIDMVVFYIFVFIIAVIFAAFAPDFLAQITDDNSGFSAIDRLFSLIFYAVYMSIVETIFRGKSFGKFITKTRAVNLDGGPIDANKAFARGFSRAVPFCIFSGFGNPCNPWQDRWTNTKVINEIL